MTVLGRRIDYQRARGLLLLVGLVVLFVIAAIMFVRRVDPIEVSATLFFLPIFVAFIVWGLRGGLIAGAAAAIGYILLRMPLIDVVGAGRFLGLIVTRSVGYLVFGGIGGWAGEQLLASINKLDLYDYIDNETRLYNSRFAVETIDLERSRSQRYEKVFSVVAVERAFGEQPRKERAALMHTLGQALRQSVRAVDSVAHVSTGGMDLFVFVLPETAGAGAGIFAAKLIEQLTGIVGTGGGGWTTSTATLPGDDDKIETLLSRLKADVAEQFPAAAAGI
ncbi:MAG: hypothetical protein OEO77_03650 [Acidimicrobiia bacterium]|nr:hypothetical protein [Acidimicrobiia bacterium]